MENRLFKWEEKVVPMYIFMMDGGLGRFYLSSYSLRRSFMRYSRVFFSIQTSHGVSVCQSVLSFLPNFCIETETWVRYLVLSSFE